MLENFMPAETGPANSETLTLPVNASFKKNIPEKNEKYISSGSSGRITPFLFTSLILSAALVLTPARADEASQSAKTIACPDMPAAKAGSGVDEYALALAYDKGACGITADPGQAVQWYTRAAEHGDMLAQYRLGEIYFTGSNGMATDFPEAKKWYLAASKLGHGLSQLRLAYLYAEAHFKGLKTDYKEAEKWFLKAAEQNAGDSRFRLGNFYHNYKRPPDLQKAIYWLTRAAEGGNRVAMFDLARMLKNGEGAPKDPAQSLMWMKKAAALDLLSAEVTLSEMYATGDGVAKDPVQSLQWTLKVAASPSAIPYWIDKAGDIFFTGWETIPKNYPQALRLYQRAAAKGDPHAEARLGRIYMQGLGIAVDKAKAREYLSQAAAAGDDEAKGLLASEK